MRHEPAKDHFSIWHVHGTTYVRLPLILFIGGVVALLALTILFWSVQRERAVALQVQNPGHLDTLLPSLVGLTESSLDRGNSVQVLQNGDQFFPSLFRDIAAARQSIHVESYIWSDGTISRGLAKVLADKARQGVEVRVLVDASGGRDLDGDVEKMLTDAGAEVAHFHPIRFSNVGRLNNRDHRKLWIMDGRIGYTGGFGISDNWSGHGQDKEHWRDTGLRITGPVVNRLQAAFCENWIEETGKIPAGPQYFPPLPPTGTSAAHVAYTSPTGSVSSVQILYYLAIKAAQHEVIIQNPYLLPDDQAIEAMADAVRRGVSVKIMVPSDQATDSAIVQHASHHHFGTLLKRGVRIWEYQPTLLHQKIIIVDGVWACVGSTNFDDRSFQLNDEISLGIADPAIAAQLRSAFVADLQKAKERHFQEWQNRPLWHKLEDGVAYMGRSQL